MAKKEFNTKLYAVVAFFGVAAALFLITFTTFKARYTAFHPEDLAKTYVDTIVQTGDGYNAFKNTVASKNQKYGDFVRKYCMYPVIYRDTDYKIGDDTEAFKGYNDESYMGEKTKNDDGSLNGQLIDTMYDFYVELIRDNGGWDSYDYIYTEYFKKLVKVREEIFGDKYMTDEIMFTALEANVRTYGDSLTGTEDEFDSNTGIQTSWKTEGAYQKAFGEEYKIRTETAELIPFEMDSYKEQASETYLEFCGISIDEISEAVIANTEIFVNDESKLQTEIVLVKIGKSWYVDNSMTDTAILYDFYN